MPDLDVLSRTDVEANVIPAMVERIVRGFRPLEIVLFGSYARGDAGPDSDVDLLVVLDRDEGREAGAITAALAGSAAPKDVVVATPEWLGRYAHVRGLVYRTALREGQRLYRRTGARTPWWAAAKEGTMTPEEVRAETSRWLDLAREDLAGAEMFLTAEPSLARHACYHAQQSAEKALKAALIWQGVDPPRTHDLDRLRDLLAADWALRSRFPDLKRLSEWAVRGRYPGRLGPEPADALAAVRQARAIHEQTAAELAACGLGASGAG